MDIELQQAGNIFAYAQPDRVSVRSSDVERQNSVDSIASKTDNSTIKVVPETKDAAGSADTESENSLDLESAVADVAEFIQAQNRHLNFTFDDSSNRSVIKVTDSDSGEIIRQIPSEEMLQLAQRINELRSDAGQAIGVLINREV